MHDAREALSTEESLEGNTFDPSTKCEDKNTMRGTVVLFNFAGSEKDGHVSGGVFRSLDQDTRPD